MSKARDSFQVIQKMVSTGQASWAIWFQLYCNFEHGGPYALVTQLYFPFLDAIYHSQIHYAILILNDLFKPKKNHHSLSYLIDCCRSEGVRKKACDDCDELLASVRSHLRGVGILRGTHFGHKRISPTLAEAVEQAGLKIRQVDEMFKAATRIISLLMPSLGIKKQEVILDSDERSKKTTNEILQMLLNKFTSLGGAKGKTKTATGSGGKATIVVKAWRTIGNNCVA
jgi:hypothetical protein